MISPSPQCVGQEFVRQYYTMLHEAPDFMHRFYSHDSSFIHGGQGDGSVHGQTNIHKKILSLNFRDCHARIRQVDSLGTIDNAVVVQVSGELSNDGKPMRRFMQTFVLAPQSPKKYYVHNDIFRYQDEVFTEENVSSEVATPSTSTAGSPESLQANCRTVAGQSPPERSVSGASKPVEIEPRESSTPLVERVDDRLDQGLKVDTPSLQVKDDEAAPNGHYKSDGMGLRKVTGDVRGGKKEEQEEETKETREECGQATPTTCLKTPQSWASVMSNKKIQSTDSQGYAEKGKPPKQDKGVLLSSTPLSGLHEPAPPLKKLEDRNSPVEEKPYLDPLVQDRMEGKAAWHSETSRHQDSIQLFVGNLPSDISANTLRKIFCKYGEVIDVRINRKVSMGKDVPNFGFVSFDTLETARKILNARPFHLDNGHRLNVEEKKSDQIKFMGGNVTVQHRTRQVTIMQPSGRAWWGGYRTAEGRPAVQGHTRTYERYGNGNSHPPQGPKAAGKCRQE